MPPEGCYQFSDCDRAAVPATGTITAITPTSTKVNIPSTSTTLVPPSGTIFPAEQQCSTTDIPTGTCSSFKSSCSFCTGWPGRKSRKRKQGKEKGDTSIHFGSTATSSRRTNRALSNQRYNL